MCIILSEMSSFSNSKGIKIVIRHIPDKIVHFIIQVNLPDKVRNRINQRLYEGA